MPVHIHHGRAESFLPPPPWLRLEPILRFHGYRDLDRVRAPIRETAEALFLDAAGWLAVEEALRAFRGHLRALVHGPGVRLSPRLGPGYLDWPLAEQALLFRLFDGETLPVALNEYCVMSPGKSISGSF